MQNYTDQRPEKISLQEVRGVDSYDTNLRIILVQSSVESVAQAFVSMKIDGLASDEIEQVDYIARQ